VVTTDDCFVMNDKGELIESVFYYAE
jgi:hypothetical protein